MKSTSTWFCTYAILSRVSPQKLRGSVIISMSATSALDKSIKEAVCVLKDRGVVAFPTDTVYGLGADGLCSEAVERVFEIKGRPSDKAVPLLLGSIQDLDKVTNNVPGLARTLVERYWPGPLTLVLRTSKQLPEFVTGGNDSVAVRMPDHHVPIALVLELGSPITGTSANPTGGPDPITAEDVARLLGNKVDYILDGGPATIGVPSTVLDLTGHKPRLLRLGAIGIESLQPYCPVILEIS